MVAQVALLIALATAVYLLVTPVLVSRRIRRMKREIRIERTRSHWALARQELWALVRDGKLSRESATFRAFHELHTFVLRRPEEYEAISQAMVKTLLVPAQRNTPTWECERGQWPAEMECVLSHMTAGTGALLLAQGRGKLFLTIVAKVVPWVTRRISGAAVAKLQSAVARALSKFRTEHDLYAAMMVMEKMQHSRFSPQLQAV